MKKLLAPRCRLLIISTLMILSGCQQLVNDPETVFRNPPESAKPGVWWHWMGCNVTKEGITKDLEAFHEAGIGSATLFGMADVCTPWAGHIENSPTDGLIAFTDPWWEMVRHAAGEARRLGIDLGIHNCPGYTHSGGPWITPELSMQEICWSQTLIGGGKTWTGTLSRPVVDPVGNMYFPVVNKETGVLEKPVVEARKTFYRDICLLALPAAGTVTPDQVINLTGKMEPDGKLIWEAPPGQWILYRFGHTTMGSMTQPNQWEIRGLECDKMSVEANEFHLNHLLGELKNHLGELVGTGLKHVLFDSYEAGAPTWTPLMAGEFASRRGYDPLRYLPVFAGREMGGAEETKKFRDDFNRTIADLYRDVHFKVASRMLADAGLQFNCEPYGGPFHTGEVAPYVHRVMTEFWSDQSIVKKADSGLFLGLDGGVHNILEAEAFTGQPEFSSWTEHPGGLKIVGDGAFCSGINRLVFHTNPLQPWDDRYLPGISMGRWGTHFSRTQTWWEPGKAWITYLQRCQALLQWGKSVPDDLRVENPTGGVRLMSAHRSDSLSHLFFVANQTNNNGTADCFFPLEGMTPELWDPVTGSMRNLRVFSHDQGQTRIPLEFEPAQSWFIVFRHPAKGTPENGGSNFSDLQAVAQLAEPWEVTFDPEWGGPAQPVTFKTLDDWTLNADSGIRYYSGTAVYRNTFDGKKGDWLDLGKVSHLASVRINDQDLGVVWCPPYRVAIPKGLLKATGNRIEIGVTNVWANRLIGDEQEPADCEWLPGHLTGGSYLKRFPDWFVNHRPRPSTGRYCFVTWNYFTAASPLTPSGLYGPVKLMSLNSNE